MALSTLASLTAAVSRIDGPTHRRLARPIPRATKALACCLGLAIATGTASAQQAAAPQGDPAQAQAQNQAQQAADAAADAVRGELPAETLQTDGGETGPVDGRLAGDRRFLPQDRFDSRRFGKASVADAYGAYQRGYYLTALRMATPLAEQGDPVAQTLLGEIYSGGHGVSVDAEKAAQWYRRAAEAGEPAAQFQYALMVLDGAYAQQDKAFAERLMKQAADAGNPEAQFNYAQMLMASGRPQDRQNAVELYEAAASRSIADADYALAQIEASGFDGRVSDQSAARHHLERAVRGGHVSAMVELAVYMINGRGGELDLKGGFRLLRRAAQMGNPAAMSQLAKAYRAGLGTEPDSLSAAAWYFTAKRAGLRDEELEVFLKGLTDAQRREALSRANALR